MKFLGFTIFPDHIYRLRSKLSKEVLLNRLQSETDQLQWQRFLPFAKRSFKVFKGKIVGDEFKVIAWPMHLQHYLPMYEGKIIEQPHGTLIEIRSSLHPLMRCLITVWLYTMLLICLILTSLILQALFNQAGYYQYHPVILFPLLLLATSLAITFLPIDVSGDEGLKDLKSLLLAQED